MPAIAYVALALLVSLAGNFYQSLQHDKLALEVDVAKGALDARNAEARAAAERHAREIERTTAEAAAAAATEYQRGLEDARLTSDRVVADLRAGNLRLRKRWQGCEAAAGSVPAAPPGGRGSDEGAELRNAGAGDLVRLAAACDAQVTGLQALVRADRGTR